MINNNSIFFIKLKILSFLLKTKINKLNSLFKKSKCDLNIYKAKFLNLNHDNIVIQEYHNSWKILTRLMMKKSFGNAIEDILIIIKKYLQLIDPSAETYEPKKISRKFNTVFSIAFFSRMICENNVKYKDQLIKSSQNIFDSFLNLINQKHTISINFTILRLVFNTLSYHTIFEKWQEFDKEFMVFSISSKTIFT